VEVICPAGGFLPVVFADRELELGRLDSLVYQPFSQPVGLDLLTAFFLVTHGCIRLGKYFWLAKVGAITYPIYLFHHNIGYVVLQRFADRLDHHLLLGIILVVLLVGAYAIHVLIEKPFSKALIQRLNASFASPRDVSGYVVHYTNSYQASTLNADYKLSSLSTRDANLTVNLERVWELDTCSSPEGQG
jgi:peptidoglycan/LPS O-acetylase OafA/YrhL